ncbi:Rv1355c family protein [Nocardia bhagyanarayanae]|uniref:Molybdopterin/thiamine biosynthesis adenylyltransferase n=1 Tax=Nocardia bhagyanarayanae TaxID=1215925 RepID=A0A543F9L9_9NOCA|nr:Rv1355c family protein [Nocardia bhagyanarayanae]TQM30521.1 molybdopterin/thiamine biosynthesis adenylyltransferase [Nocardia bhagyanarayanae]
MNGDPGPGADYRPLILDETVPDEASVLTQLRKSPMIRILDLRDVLHAELRKVHNPPDDHGGPETDRWVYYPWRRTLVGLPGEQTFRAIRLDRNRNKVTRDEQRRLAGLAIGVVGQSVGHAIAHTLAMEGSCGLLRLADFDDIELSNLNRVPGNIFDIGVNKSIVTARRIAELDPYLPVEVYTAGIDERSVDEFLRGLSIVVEECDSLDVKFAVREGARRHRLPLLMDTSDRGLFDVERYDLEPERPPFHGLLGTTTAADLRGLSTKEKAPHVMRILDPKELSARMAASLVEIDETVTTWPQLGGDVQLGAAIVATAVRRIGLGYKLSSGRTRIDLERGLDGLAEPEPEDLVWENEPDPTAVPSGPARVNVLHCAQRAPSGGNTQPWLLRIEDDALRIELAPNRSSSLDIGYRGSAVAIGAALHNARAAAAAHGILGGRRFLEDDGFTALLEFGSGSDPLLARDYPAALARDTNRKLGTGAPLDDGVLAGLAAAAAAEGGAVRAITGRAELAHAAALIGESDRIRHLTPRLHQEMYGELRWPGEDLRTGIDVRGMELAPDEQAKVRIGGRADVMARLHEWSGGVALGEYSRDRVLSSSALVAVTLPCRPGPDGASLADYATAGAALQRVWLEAGRRGLAVQPVSPVFLYARHPDELIAISPDFADTLTSLQGRFLDLLGVPGHEIMALVLRLSYAAAATVRSRRLPVPGAGDRS